MRLLIITQVLDRTDAVLGFFHTWCEEFSRHVESLVVVAQRVGENSLPANVEVVSLGKEQGAGKLAMLGRLTACLATAFGKSRPDAVWAHMVPKFVLYAAPVCKPRRIPLYLWYTHKGVDRSLRMAVPLVRRVFTASEESFRYEAGRHKRLVTGHGIDCTHFRPGPEHRPVDVLAVGRLAPSKGQNELLEALSLLPECPVTEIAGDVLLESDEPFRDALHARVAGLGGPISFLGAVSYVEVAGVMQRAKVLVNTSHTGSVDKVVLEAMACGTIPLTCNESFERIFGAELAMRLMFARDDPSTLAAKLDELLSLPADERVQLGRQLSEQVSADHDLAALMPRLVESMEQSS